jgi:hypothetical protein
MIVLAEAYARYSSTLSEQGLGHAAEDLLTFAEGIAQDYYGDRYREFGIAISVRIEIGTTRVWITVFAASALQIFVQYGSIRQSIDYAIKDGQTITRRILPEVPQVLNIPDRYAERHEQRLGLSGRLRRLFTRVERGELSVDEAVSRAIELLEKSEESLEAVTKLKQQLDVEFHTEVRPGRPSVEPQYSLGSREGPSIPGSPIDLPSLPRKPEPVLAAPPGTERRRRRRKGVVATRYHATGDLRIYMY